MLKSLRRGRSVDNGFRNRKALEIVHCDQFTDTDLAANIFKDLHRRPVDEQVIEKITFQGFIENLTDLELRFVQHRIVGWPVGKIMRKLDVSGRVVKTLI